MLDITDLVGKIDVPTTVIVGDADKVETEPLLRRESVLQTIEAVRRVSGRNFAVQYSARRPGDIMTMIADTSRIRATLDWTPQYDHLDTIAMHALAWEEKLLHERRTVMHAASA